MIQRQGLQATILFLCQQGASFILALGTFLFRVADGNSLVILKPHLVLNPAHHSLGVTFLPDIPFPQDPVLTFQFLLS